MSLFLRADLSQAEDRVVKVLSQDPELIELAQTKPWEFDVHTYNAAIVFQIEEKDVSKLQRYASKRVVHLSNYGGSPQRASEALMEEGFSVSVEECIAGRNRYYKRFPGITEGYHKRVRTQVIEYRKLVNSYGFGIEFPYERLDDALFRRAFAWRPQSEVGFLLNQQGVIPAYEWIQQHAHHSRIAFQVHDEIAIAIGEVAEAWDLARVVRDSLEAERTYDGAGLSIPAEFALESRYHGRKGEVVEWKMFPTKEEFQNVFEQLNRE